MGKQLKIISIGLICLLFLVELMLLTHWNGRLGAHKSSLLLFSASLGLGFLGIYYSMVNFRLEASKHFLSLNSKRIISIIVPIAFVLVIGFRLQDIFIANPLDKLDTSQSDIIPLVMFMVDRFLEGNFPYAPVSDWGYTLTPTYMPFQWMPFSLARIFSFDFRWIPFAVMAIGLIAFQAKNLKSDKSDVLFILFSMLPWVVWLMVVNDEAEVFAYTIEGMSVGYYIIFCLCILSKRPILIGLGIGLCLLSRYSFALWLPLLGFVFLIDDYKKLLPSVGIPALMLVLIYIIPFLSQNFSAFTDSLASYTVAAEGEWAPYWQQAGEKPYHLFRGIGVAGIFYDFGSGDILTRIKSLQFWHFASSLGISFLLAGFYWIYKKRIDITLFLVASLKVYFVFFYYFIQVPYSYLFIVPLFVSILVLFAVSHKMTSVRE